MYLPNHLHFYWSILDGSIKLDKLTERLADYNLGSAMITDHGSMSGAIEFNTQLSKKGIKAIIGNEFYFANGSAKDKSELNRRLSHMVICAKNYEGYKELCKLTSRSHDEDCYYYKPRLDIELLKKFNCKNLLFFTGHFGSLLHNVLSTVSPAEQMIVGEKYLNRLIDIVGKGNLNIEIQRICCPDNDYAELMRSLAKRVGIRYIACIDAHYVDKSEAKNQRLLLASALQTTLRKYKTKLADSGLISFFEHDYYHLASPEEMQKVHPEDELKASLEVAELCEEYKLSGQPILPKFCENESELLKEQCRDGWKNILEKYNALNDSNKDIYKKRVENELDIINEFGLAGYFLIVRDFVIWARNQGSLACARGSAGGSLVSYLVGVTTTDPIPNKLIFSRFLNKGRFTKDNIEYPDIDIDFPPSIRDKVVEYIKEKYGRENVAQISTFGTLKGASAIDTVLRMHEVCSFMEIKEITKYIPNEAAISDQLEEQDEESILMFTLKNMPAVLENYCKIENGELTGEYAEYFKQAIEIEGSIKSQGIHAAGLVISPTTLSDFCPMVRGKNEEKICGYDMHGIKKLGLIKFDTLGVGALDKLMYVNNLLKGNNV